MSLSSFALLIRISFGKFFYIGFLFSSVAQTLTSFNFKGQLSLNYLGSSNH